MIAGTTRVLTIHDEMIQGTEEWYDQRRGMVTASEVGSLITASTVKVAANVKVRELTARLAAERITDYTDPTYMGDDMWRGTEDEPRALGAYADAFRVPVKTCGFMVREFQTDWRDFKIGYSPDGLVGDDGLIEVKSRRQKKHLQTVVSGEVPAENMAQLQCALLVSGRTWIDYVSFCGGMAMWVKRVVPDERWQAAIVEAVAAFEQEAEGMLADYNRATDGLPATERVAYGDVELKL